MSQYVQEGPPTGPASYNPYISSTQTMPANMDEQLKPLMTHQPLSHARGAVQTQFPISEDFSSPILSNNPLPPASGVWGPPGQRMDHKMSTYPETPIMGHANIPLQQPGWNSQVPPNKTPRARIADMTEKEKLDRRREQNRTSQAKLRMNRENNYRIIAEARDKLAEKNFHLKVTMNALKGELAFWHERELSKINTKREKQGLPVFPTFYEMVQSEKGLAHCLSEFCLNGKYLAHGEQLQENPFRRSSDENSGDIVSDELFDSTSAPGSSCSPTHASIISPPGTTAGNNNNTLVYTMPAYTYSAVERNDPYATPGKAYRAVDYATPTSSEKTGKRRRVMSPLLDSVAEEMSDSMFLAPPGSNVDHDGSNTQTSVKSQVLDPGSYFARDAPSSSGFP